MDIKSLFTADAHEAGAECHIKDREGNETDVVITIKGVDSPSYERAFSRVRKRYSDRLASGKDEEFDGAGVAIDTLCEIIIDWRGLTDSGEIVKFSKKAARQLLEQSPSTRVQLESFVYKSKNFTKG